MKLKCSECGNKVSSSDKTCPVCGYVLYEEIFGSVAAEVKEELSRVTEAELIKVKKESSKSVEEYCMAGISEVSGL